MAEHGVASKCAVPLLCLPTTAQPVIGSEVYCFPYVKTIGESGMICLGECYEESPWAVLHLEDGNVVCGEQGGGDLSGHVVQLIGTLEAKKERKEISRQTR